MKRKEFNWEPDFFWYSFLASRRRH